MIQNPFKELLYIRHSNARKLTNVFGCAYATAWKKVNDPSLLTVKDLFAMESCGVATVNEVLDAIRKEKDVKH